MTKYRLKPENIEAVKFNGNNWFEVVRLLGPHLTKTEQKWEDAEEYSVFDIGTKQWVTVAVGEYVVKFSDGNIEVVNADVFEARWEPEPPTSLFPPTTYPQPGINPYPYRATWTDGILR